jgi:hypothetical protein
MPCRDWLEKETSAADERIKHLKTDVDKIRTKMNLLTRLLCEAGNIINNSHDSNWQGHLRDEMSQELKDWLWTHNKEDRKRNK